MKSIENITKLHVNHYEKQETDDQITYKLHVTRCEKHQQNITQVHVNHYEKYQHTAKLHVNPHEKYRKYYQVTCNSLRKVSKILPK